MTERIIEFLRGPVWRAHSIKSAEEAYVDLLACPAKERPRTFAEMAERWKITRQTASKFWSQMIELGLSPDVNAINTDVNLVNTDVNLVNTDVNETNIDVKAVNISPSRVNSNNIPHNISSPHNNNGVDEKVFDESLIPSAEEVQAYINATGGALFTGDAFVDYYTSRCLWNAQNVRPHVWQATVRTWRRRDKPPLQLPPPGGGHVASNPSTINHTPSTINSNPLTLNQKPYATTSYGRPSNGEAERDERRRSFAEHIRRQLQNPDDELEMPF